METIKRQESSKVVVKKLIPAGKEEVFDALTNVEKMQRWMIGKTGVAKVQADVKVGGAYSNEMCFQDENTKEVTVFKHSGEYLEISPPNRIVFTWNSPFAFNTIVTFELTSKGDSTEVKITHELGNQGLDEGEDQFESHEQGWNFSLSKLGEIFV